MPNYFNPYQYPYYPGTQPQTSPQTQQTVQQQIQNGGFVSVRSELEARNYPIAPGNSITFKDETAPYVYTKTMGFSQLDRPIFEKFKLVKEDATETPNLTQNEVFDPKPMTDSINQIKGEIESIWAEIEGIKNSKKPAPSSKKKEVTNDDAE